jgi:hypothetical protein
MMNNIELKTDVTNIPGSEKFMKTCFNALERLAALAPSDNSIQMSVDQKGDTYLVAITVASQELRFALETAAKSPFMALEQTFKDSLEKVMKWSASRQLKLA